MNMMDQTNEDLPSNRVDLLRAVKSLFVTNLIRYSWDDFEYVVQNLGVSPEDVFRFTLGPLVIVLENGVRIGFNSIPEQASVVVWLEDSPDFSEDRDNRLDGDEDFYPVEVTDTIYGDEKISKVIDSRIEMIHILKREPKNAILAALPREVGVMLTFSNGINLVASHGLHNDSDDFSVIVKEDISNNIFPQVQLLPV